MTQFWIGTSGWYYEHWRGRFYPDGLAKKEWLPFYARHFATVELNNSFYRKPGSETWDAWARLAPPGFKFAVKASRYITHLRRLQDCREPLSVLITGAERLGERLGPFLYQLPPSFRRTEEHSERLETFLALLPPRHRHVVEFRHASWFGDETLAQLGRHGVAFCAYDLPGVSCPLVATSPFAYVRLHGTAGQYAGNYSEEMLTNWARRLLELSRGLDEVWVYFNNDAYGFAVANAVTLASLLESQAGTR